MGYHRGTKLIDDPIIVYLNEKIRLQRLRLEWLLEVRLPEAQRNAVSHIEYTLNDGNIQSANVAVLNIQRILEVIDEESKQLQDSLSERSGLLGTELSEDLYCTEKKFFEDNGRRWATEADKNG